MKDCELTILRNERVADGIYEMLLTRPEGVSPKGAQFVHIELKDGSRILRRPFCICDCDEEGLLVCYALVGAGTRELASYKVGEKVKAALPLGNGWDADAFRSPVLLGGGMGSAADSCLHGQRQRGQKGLCDRDIGAGRQVGRDQAGRHLLLRTRDSL